MNEFKDARQLALENPNALDFLSNPHNFSSNPGFISTSGMLGRSMPANGDGTIRSTSARGSLPSRNIGPSKPVSPASSR